MICSRTFEREMHSTNIWHTLFENRDLGMVDYLSKSFFLRWILPVAFEESEKAKRSEIYVEKYLVTNKYVEVQPIKERTLIELSEYANFYAEINDDAVSIIIKIKDKEETYEYKKILKDCFYDCYRVKEEK